HSFCRCDLLRHPHGRSPTGLRRSNFERRLLMKRCLIAFLVLGCTASPDADAKNPVVEIKTSMGTIKVELDEAKAPVTVKNFLKYVDDKHYDSTIFHRVIDGFMIQGGGFTKDLYKATNRAEF